ncbi:hypothetical protein DFJ77DRAFT_1447 [Powellomyces hirtus]|nr:hypothetical protein DFJ77DRAFT_1447 [Powellomyces hirtus]
MNDPHSLLMSLLCVHCVLKAVRRWDLGTVGRTKNGGTWISSQWRWFPANKEIPPNVRIGMWIRATTKLLEILPRDGATSRSVDRARRACERTIGTEIPFQCFPYFDALFLQLLQVIFVALSSVVVAVGLDGGFGFGSGFFRPAIVLVESVCGLARGSGF